MTNEQELEIANEVMGSCLTAHELLLRLNLVGVIQEHEVHAAAANHGEFLCYTCGWWNEENDIYNAEICNECYEDEQG